MDASVTWNFPPLTLFLNCLCTFILNLSVFLVISRTSALTARVTGVVRYYNAIAIAGVVAYNNHKLKVKPQTNQQQGADSKANPGNPRDVETFLNTTKEGS